jgi:hypothetical protein
VSESTSRTVVVDTDGSESSLRAVLVMHTTG